MRELLMDSAHSRVIRIITLMSPSGPEFGYTDQDITVLQDDHYTAPTRTNVLDAIRTLAQDAQPGDRFVFNCG